MQTLKFKVQECLCTQTLCTQTDEASATEVWRHVPQKQAGVNKVISNLCAQEQMRYIHNKNYM